MTKSKRTDPLDRDGDGKPGGSLPGNQTAPMADAAAPPSDADTAAAVEALDRAFADSPADIDATGNASAQEPPVQDPATETPVIAARVADLEILVGAKRLYRSDAGYSSNYGAPFVSEATMAEFLKAGLAEAIPSAGVSGGVKATVEARRQLGVAKREQAA